MMGKKIKYKDTGIPYCPQIPESWNVKRLKFVGKSIIGITYNPTQVTDEENGKLVLRSSNVQNGVLSFEDNVYVNSEISDKHLSKEGDILICARNGSAHLVGKCAYIAKEYEGLTFGAFMLMFRSEFGKFMYYVFNSNLFKSQTGLYKTSTINQLTSDTINNLFVALPSNKQEQEKIAKFLDLKTVEIDTIISKKRNLIECLKEEKIAKINQAITEGINSKVNLKNSEIHWLGSIPKHWQIKKIKYLVSKVGSGVTPSGGASVYINEGIPLLRSQNVYNDGLRLDDVSYISDVIDEKMKNSRVFEGDVLLNVTGASIGRCYFIPEDFGKGNVNQHVCIIRPVASLIDSKFLYFIMISKVGQLQIDYNQTGANREGLNFEQIKNFTVPLPPLNEQKEIVKFMELIKEHLDKTINKIEQEIQLIKEYKSSLINEIVTGQIILN